MALVRRPNTHPSSSSTFAFIYIACSSAATVSWCGSYFDCTHSHLPSFPSPADFPAHVSAHRVIVPGQTRPRTTILIRFDDTVMNRESA